MSTGTDFTLRESDHTMLDIRFNLQNNLPYSSARHEGTARSLGQLGDGRGHHRPDSRGQAQGGVGFQR
jgi:hypothetical protein